MYAMFIPPGGDCIATCTSDGDSDRVSTRANERASSRRLDSREQRSTARWPVRRPCDARPTPVRRPTPPTKARGRTRTWNTPHSTLQFHPLPPNTLRFTAFTPPHPTTPHIHTNSTQIGPDTHLLLLKCPEFIIHPIVSASPRPRRRHVLLRLLCPLFHRSWDYMREMPVSGVERRFQLGRSERIAQSRNETSVILPTRVVGL